MPSRRSLSLRQLAAAAGVAAVAAAMLVAPGSQAGEWHRLGRLACSDCHTMHNSQGGQPMRYDNNAAPAQMLLRAATATELCLSCHSGQPNAPSVMVPTDFDPPGGGFPPDLADPGHVAHALGPDPVVPPEGDTAVVMSCVTCHEPHGNERYRNLRPSPSGTGRAADIPLVVDQGVTANGVNAADVYKRSNVRYRTGMSEWCMDCHNLSWGTHTPSVPLSSSPFVDLGYWLTAPITNRVPVQSPTDLIVPSADDEVFCLSCHKAHGTPHAGMELWADGDAGGLDATCMQCHP